MPVTAVRTKDKSGQELRLQFMTIPSEKGLLIDIYMCDPEFVPTGKPEHLLEEVDEVEYHKKLREAATEAAEFEPGYSSNPEWNPGYVEESETPIFKIDDVVIAKNNAPLPGNQKSPELEIDKEYTVKEILLDSKGNQHLDVGLPSSLNYVTSYETKEELERGDEIHWCHPSRFVLKL